MNRGAVRSLGLGMVTIFLLAGCGRSKVTSPETFVNVLDFRNVPVAERDGSAHAFSDQGAWFGFALPDSGQGLGGFTGPLLHTSGRWLGPSIAGLRLTDAESGQVLDWREAEAVHELLPGRLRSRYRFAGLTVDLDLAFASSRTALIRARLTSDTSRKIRLAWTGRTFGRPCPQSIEADGWMIDLGGGDQARLTWPDDPSFAYTQNADGLGYTLSAEEPVQLTPDSPWTTVLAFSLTFDAAEWPSESASVRSALMQPDEAFRAVETRWSGYLDRVLASDSPLAKDPDGLRLAVKSLITLVMNWKAARGDLLHDGFFPSSAVWYFNGFWGWDTWKIAAAWARFAPDVAQDGIRAMFDWQDATGMLPDVIYADKRENNWRDTKPPLAAWAVWSVYEGGGDRAFLREMWPKLTAFHGWWFTNRDHDGNGLCEYGSTDGTLEAARWESGMDDGLRYDQTSMVQNGPQAWSMDQESVDLSAYLCMDKLYLSRIAQALGLAGEAARYRDEAETLKARIQSHFWDEADGWFYDVKLGGGGFVRVKGPEGWIPLTWNLATPAQAERVRQAMMDPAQFATAVPFPTIPADHPAYMTGYWRGPVWLDQAGFGVRALRNYGFVQDAEAMTRKLLEFPQGLLRGDAPIHENYDPRDGSPLKAPHFSWSAAHLLLLYWGW